jgi:hypothetical protein
MSGSAAHSSRSGHQGQAESRTQPRDMRYFGPTVPSRSLGITHQSPDVTVANLSLSASYDVSNGTLGHPRHSRRTPGIPRGRRKEVQSHPRTERALRISGNLTMSGSASILLGPNVFETRRFARTSPVRVKPGRSLDNAPGPFHNQSIHRSRNGIDDVNYCQSQATRRASGVRVRPCFLFRLDSFSRDEIPTLAHAKHP